MDYLDVVIHTPLYLYHFGVSVWDAVYNLPWPARSEWFGSLAIFLGLYPVRLIMAVVIPEKKVAKRIYKRRKSVPTQGEHHSAAAASSNIFHLH